MASSTSVISLLTVLSAVLFLCVLGQGPNTCAGRNRRSCRFSKDCQTVRCAFPGPALSRRGCPFKGCPCGTRPPILGDRCRALSCRRNCGPNGWVINRKGCNTCRCRRRVQPQCPLTVDCASVTCQSPVGPARDANGCVYPGCPCSFRPPILIPNTCPVCVTTPCPCNERCPALFCPKDCSANGWVKDKRGCNTCTCAPTPPTCTHSKDCAVVLCQRPGPALDSNRCPFKGCPCGVAPPILPPITCPQCVTAPCPCSETCPTLSCLKDCGVNGWVKDSKGCNTCTCAKDCPPVCAIFCPFGNVLDERGCPTCRCKEDPNAPRPGRCPSLRQRGGTNSCTRDSDCQGNYKCCSVGAYVTCLPPVL